MTRAAGPVELVDAHPDWPRVAWQEIGELWRVLAPWRDGGVHHVGSTAVPGLPARPVIDLLAGLADAEQSSAAGAALEAAGWRHGAAPEANGREPGSLTECYARAHPDGTVVRVVLLTPGSPRWRAAILFRDRLRADPQARSAYARAKRRGARDGDRRDYERRKQASFERIVGAR